MLRNTSVMAWPCGLMCRFRRACNWMPLSCATTLLVFCCFMVLTICINCITGGHHLSVTSVPYLNEISVSVENMFVDCGRISESSSLITELDLSASTLVQKGSPPGGTSKSTDVAWDTGGFDPITVLAVGVAVTKKDEEFRLCSIDKFAQIFCTAHCLQASELCAQHVYQLLCHISPSEKKFQHSDSSSWGSQPQFSGTTELLTPVIPVYWGGVTIKPLTPDTQASKGAATPLEHMLIVVSTTGAKTQGDVIQVPFGNVMLVKNSKGQHLSSLLDLCKEPHLVDDAAARVQSSLPKKEEAVPRREVSESTGSDGGSKGLTRIISRVRECWQESISHCTVTVLQPQLPLQEREHAVGTYFWVGCCSSGHSEVLSALLSEEEFVNAGAGFCSSFKVMDTGVSTDARIKLGMQQRKTFITCAHSKCRITTLPFSGAANYAGTDHSCEELTLKVIQQALVKGGWASSSNGLVFQEGSRMSATYSQDFKCCMAVSNAQLGLYHCFDEESSDIHPDWRNWRLHLLCMNGNNRTNESAKICQHWKGKMSDVGKRGASSNVLFILEDFIENEQGEVSASFESEGTTATPAHPKGTGLGLVHFDVRPVVAGKSGVNEQPTEAVISSPPDMVDIPSRNTLQQNPSSFFLKATLPDPLLPIPRFEKILFKLVLCVLFSSLVLFIRMIRQERLRIANATSQNFCDYTISFQSVSSQAHCIKTSLPSRSFEFSFSKLSSFQDSEAQNAPPQKQKVNDMIPKATGNGNDGIPFFRRFDSQVTVPNVRVQVSNVNAELAEEYKGSNSASASPGKSCSIDMLGSNNLEPYCQTAHTTCPDQEGCHETCYKSNSSVNALSCHLESHALPVMSPVLTHSKTESLSKGTGSLEAEKEPQSPGFLQKEKDRAKRRKRKKNLMKLKLEAEKGCQSGSSSPSSPASPATPLSSSYTSPFLRSDCLATSIGSLFATGAKSTTALRNMELSNRTLSQLDVVGPNRLSPTAKNHSRHSFGSKGNMDKVSPKAIVATSSNVSLDPLTMQSLKDRCMKPVGENWAAVVRRAIATCEVAPLHGLPKQALPGKAGESIPKKPVLLPSATFPQAGQRNSRCRSNVMEEKIAPSLISTSPIAPDARAPGSSRLATKLCVESPKETCTGQTCELVYDIWGDHFGDITRTCALDSPPLQQDGMAVKSPLQLHNCQSFFAKPGFLMSGSSSNPPSAFSVFSTDTLFSCPLKNPTSLFSSKN